MRKNLFAAIALLFFQILTAHPAVAAPGPFSILSPANGAAGVNLAPLLTWTAATDAVLYRVYFGTANPVDPNRFYTVTTGTSFSPAAANAYGPLLPGVTYYWSVDAVAQLSDTTTNLGGVFSFRTLSDRPDAFSLLSPANGSIRVTRTPTLTWEAAVGAASYQVHFGTTNPPPVANTYTATGAFFTPSTSSFGALSAGATYYWSVDAVAENGNTTAGTGGVWSFTTVPAASGPTDYDDNAPIQAGYAVVTPTAGNGSSMVVFETFGLKADADTRPAGITSAAMTTSAVLFSGSGTRLSRDMGLAIANPGASAAIISLVLRVSDGTPLGTKIITLGPRQQTAQFVSQLFGVTQDISGSISIGSSNPVAVVGLRFRGALFSTLPVASLSAPTSVPVISPGVGGAGSAVLPQFAAGGGWASEIVIVNTGSAALTVRVDLFKPDGTPLITGMNRTLDSTFSGLVVPGNGVLSLVPRDISGDSRF